MNMFIHASLACDIYDKGVIEIPSLRNHQISIIYDFPFTFGIKIKIRKTNNLFSLKKLINHYYIYMQINTFKHHEHKIICTIYWSYQQLHVDIKT